MRAAPVQRKFASPLRNECGAAERAERLAAMFEGWLYPLIASYLGHYVKGLQKEQARRGGGFCAQTQRR